MTSTIPLPDAKLTTEAEIVERLESVRRQHREAVNAPIREGCEHISTMQRRHAKISKLYHRMDMLEDRLRDIRRRARLAPAQA